MAGNNKTLMMESLNQRVGINDEVAGGGTKSIARTSNVDSAYQDNTFDSLAISRRDVVLPNPRDKTLKLKTFSKTKTQAKKQLLRTIPEST